MLKPEPLRQLWTVTDDECQSVSAPLEGWIRQLTPEALAKVEKFAYPVMVGIAIAGVTLPRFIMEMQYSKALAARNSKTPSGAAPASSQYPVETGVSDDVAESIKRSMRQ
jgi:hypothetical protein